MAGGMPQLDVSTFPSQLFWLTVCFGGLYYVMSKHILPRIHEILEHRQIRVSNDLDQAEKLRDEAESAQRDYSYSLAQARQEAEKIRAAANEIVAKEAAERHRKLDETLNRQLEEADQRLNRLRDSAREKLMPVAEEAVQQIVAQLVGSKPSDKDVRDVLTRYNGQKG